MRDFLFIPGIRTDVENQAGWALRAKEFVEDHTPDRADWYAYETFATTRWTEQQRHVRNVGDRMLRKQINRPNERRIVACHSNGAAIALQTFVTHPLLRIHDLHLIAPAAHASFIDNGLNEAIEGHRIQRVYIYGSANDRALKLAGWSRFLFGWLGLGYGDLGRTGPQDMTGQAKAATQCFWRDDFDHSDWFSERNFPALMHRICEV